MVLAQATRTAVDFLWVGGMVSISLVTYVLWLWVRRKKAQYQGDPRFSK